MSYYVLRTKAFSAIDTSPSSVSGRMLYLLKKRDVPLLEQKHILSLKCASIQRVSGVSKLIKYLDMYTSDNNHETQPYILKRVSWNEVIDLFGFDDHADTSESDSESSSV